MRGLTLYQPWATLVALADAKRYPDQGDLCKRIETRPRRISYRGPLAIHAAKTFPARCRDLIMDTGHPTFTEALHRGGYSWVDLMFAMSAKHEALPLGKVVAVARLVDCLQVVSIDQPGWLGPVGTPEYAFGDYRPGRWGWFLEDITALPEPIPCRGMQGLWHVPADVVYRGDGYRVGARGRGAKTPGA